MLLVYLTHTFEIFLQLYTFEIFLVTINYGESLALFHVQHNNEYDKGTHPIITHFKVGL